MTTVAKARAKATSGSRASARFSMKQCPVMAPRKKLPGKNKNNGKIGNGK